MVLSRSVSHRPDRISRSVHHQLDRFYCQRAPAAAVKLYSRTAARAGEAWRGSGSRHRGYITDDSERVPPPRAWRVQHRWLYVLPLSPMAFVASPPLVVRTPLSVVTLYLPMLPPSVRSTRSIDRCGNGRSRRRRRPGREQRRSAPRSCFATLPRTTPTHFAPTSMPSRASLAPSAACPRHPRLG